MSKIIKDKITRKVLGIVLKLINELNSPTCCSSIIPPQRYIKVKAGIEKTI